MLRTYKFTGNAFKPVVDKNIKVPLFYMRAEDFYVLLHDTLASERLNEYLAERAKSSIYYIVLFKKLDNKYVLLEYDYSADLMRIDMHKNFFLEG